MRTTRARGAASVAALAIVAAGAIACGTDDAPGPSGAGLAERQVAAEAPAATGIPARELELFRQRATLPSVRAGDDSATSPGGD